MLGSKENRKERKKVFVQFCAKNIYRNYLYIVISRNQSRNNSVDRYNINIRIYKYKIKFV